MGLRESCDVEGKSGEAAQRLYRQAYEFLDYVIADPRMDHLDVRFGREVIFDREELEAREMIVEPHRRTVEEVLPETAVTAANNTDMEMDGFQNAERM